MIETVAYFLEQPLSARNQHRFGIEILRANGFNVCVYNFAPVLQLETRGRQALPEAVPVADEVVVRNRHQAATVFADLAVRKAFVVLLVGISPTSLWLFAALSRRQVRYAVASVGTVPADPRAASWSARVSRLMRERSTGRIAADLVARAAFVVRRRFTGSPTHHLVAGSEAASQARSSGAIIWVHALDYDRFLENGQLAKSDPHESSVVFLDQYLPSHPDFSITNTPFPVRSSFYYRSLRRYFDKVEQRLGLPVTIAAHPKADYRDTPTVFGPRAIVDGNTISLVRGAQLVLAHYSTAVNFAVLFRKPLLFLTTAELESSGLSGQIHAVADRLGAPVIDIDAPDAGALLPTPDEPSYARFIHSFITTRPDDSRYTWQIVADELKQM